MADRVIRVFIPSPGDVPAERRRAALVCNRLGREFARFFEVRPVLWEYEPMLTAGHFQDVIKPAPSDADIVAVILWSRLGTPLPAETDKRRYEGIDGRLPVSEFDHHRNNSMSPHGYKRLFRPRCRYDRSTPDSRYSTRSTNESARRS